MKKTIRPFDFGSLMLLLIGLIFPLITLYGNAMLIFNSFSLSSMFLIILGITLSYCISLDALKIVFTSKFVFYDDHFEVKYYDTVTDYYSSGRMNFFRIITSRNAYVKYSDIEKFGSFEGSQLYKNGRDESNRILVTAVFGKKTYDFVVPQQYDALRNYFLINDKDKNSWLIDGKLYSAAQVYSVLREIEKHTGIQSTGGYPAGKKAALFIIVWGFAAVFGAGLGLPRLEAYFNQAHDISMEYSMKSVYVILGLLFAVISSLGFIIIANKPSDEQDSKKRLKAGLAVLAVSLVFLAATAFAFIKTVSY